MDIENVLRRGFSITRRESDDRIVTSARDLQGVEPVVIRFSEGSARGTVSAMKENQTTE
jgi:exonuclease VII large subunit